MATILMTDANAAVTKLLSLPTKISTAVTTVIDDALELAVVRHNDIRPVIATEEFNGVDGQVYYDLSELEYWDGDFSEVFLVECPAALTTEAVKTTDLDENGDWEIRQTSEGKFLYLTRYRPTSDTLIRIHYSYPRQWELVKATPPATDYYTLDIPSEDVMPLYWLTASIVTDPVSSYYARILAADQTSMTAIDWSNSSRIYSNLSKSYAAQYERYISRFHKRAFVLLDATSRYPYPYMVNLGYLHHRR